MTTRFYILVDTLTKQVYELAEVLGHANICENGAMFPQLDFSGEINSACKKDSPNTLSKSQLAKQDLIGLETPQVVYENLCDYGKSIFFVFFRIDDRIVSEFVLKLYCRQLI